MIFKLLKKLVSTTESHPTLRNFSWLDLFIYKVLNNNNTANDVAVSIFWTLPTNGSFIAFSLKPAWFRSQQQCLATMPAWWVLVGTKSVVLDTVANNKVHWLLPIAKNLSMLLMMAVINTGSSIKVFNMWDNFRNS